MLLKIGGFPGEYPKNVFSFSVLFSFLKDSFQVVLNYTLLLYL